MANNASKLTLSPETVTDEDGFWNYLWLEADGRRFYWDAEEGCYPGLYVEPGLNDLNQTVTEDSYWEIED